MDEDYDVVVCGTGLSQCIISGLMSQDQKKVLHIDRNGFYGEDGASLNLTACWKYFKREDLPPKEYGQNRDWNIDLIPKFIMADGKLVKMLLKTKVAKYLDWKSIDATYVYQMKDAGFFSKGGGTICKVPSNDGEALKSDLMGILEKRRCKNFFIYVQNFNIDDPKTWDGQFDLRKTSFSQIVNYFQLQENTIDFIGHAVALYTNDEFLKKPALETIQKIKLYMDSIGQFGDSPFIYPIYGLGGKLIKKKGIPEGFSRMCAVFGGTFMLNTDIQKIIFENGKVAGVQNGDQIAKCKMVICSPQYAINCGLQGKKYLKIDRLKPIGKIIRCICILDHPLPNSKSAPSAQVIIPQRQTGRKSDIYVMMVSSVHSVCAKGYYIAIVSTNVETNQPEKEIEAGLELVGTTLQKFIKISDVYEPNNSLNDGLFITKSVDAQSHFESLTQDVLDLYKTITGQDIDLVNLPPLEEY